MTRHQVAIFRPYPLQRGQKIRIDEGKRKGDWEVVAVGERTMTLRCPISGREFEWERFCYLLEERADEPWPRTE
jgi:hypothetical protein